MCKHKVCTQNEITSVSMCGRNTCYCTFEIFWYEGTQTFLFPNLLFSTLCTGLSGLKPSNKDVIYVRLFSLHVQSAKARLKIMDKEYKDLQWEHDVLEQRFEQVRGMALMVKVLDSQSDYFYYPLKYNWGAIFVKTVDLIIICTLPLYIVKAYWGNALSFIFNHHMTSQRIMKLSGLQIFTHAYAMVTVFESTSNWTKILDNLLFWWFTDFLVSDEDYITKVAAISKVAMYN